MNIDPRVLKTLLQLQMSTNLNANGANATGASDNASMFNAVLQQLMSSSDNSAALSALSDAGALNNESTSAMFLQPLVAASYGSSSALQGVSDIGGTELSSAPVSAGSNAAYDDLINQAGAKHGVSPSLIKAVIDTESSFNANAESHAGAKGLMQLMDGTARGLGVTDSFDPQQNIEGGTKFLAYLLEKYDGNEKAALAAYNAGPGRVDRAGIKTNEDFTAQMGNLPKETQKYVGKVLGALNEYTA
ncbi:lytic transglycosylase domain-containing protein [Paenibacillus methanolicus]|uniref:Transglycosylase-like protein with SLT domain n=1 Tax=Paenibacillus methanolicus TaxID=582686 RepID=A0A5S5CIE5_9BACL|nr:lytic transglycosylase domain-containing protein [Paenibacillus methanolicus]TYP77986.1 transglycosylase-like protein with SLT domain [Paenibacillus methanolicus]